MSKSICPRCKEVILNFGDDPNIECLRCGTVVKFSSSSDESDVVDKED